MGRVGSRRVARDFRETAIFGPPNSPRFKSTDPIPSNASRPDSPDHRGAPPTGNQGFPSLIAISFALRMAAALAPRCYLDFASPRFLDHPFSKF